MKKYIGQHIFDYVASFRQNVGIGTDTPSYKLDVFGIINTDSNYRQGGVKILGRESSNTILEAGGSNDIIFENNSSENVRITSSGNVGIGLTNPSQKLEVSGNIKATDSVGPYLNLYRSDNIIASGNHLGSIVFGGGPEAYPDSPLDDAAIVLKAQAAGTAAASDSPSRLIIQGIVDGSATLSDWVTLEDSNATFAGDVVLQNNKNIKFDNSVGTPVGVMNFNASNELVIYNGNSPNGDILFKDGGPTGTTNLTIDGATGNATFVNDVTVSGNLTVSGTTTTIDTTNLNVEDKNITINYSTGDSSSTADGAGITIQDAVDSSNDATILWDATNDEFDFSHGATFSGAVNFGVDGTGVDVKFFGDTSGRDMFWLQAQDALILKDNTELRIGSGYDLRLLHDGSHSRIKNYNGDLYITQRQDDGDIIFQSDDGSGGNTTYFKLSGANTNIELSKNLYAKDDVKIAAGNGLDLRMYHESSSNDSFIRNATGNLYIRNVADDKDIIFQSDDGSGGETEYFRVDGGAEKLVVSKPLNLIDTIGLKLGTGGNDFSAYHNGTDTYLDNNTGNLNIRNTADDKDIKFVCDDQSGGVTTYFFLDGSNSSGNPVTIFPDNSKLTIGTSSHGISLLHDGSNSTITNAIGDLTITNFQDDGDIVFKSDDGSGSTTAYLTLDGSEVKTIVNQTMEFQDNVKLAIGNSEDLTIDHNATNSRLINYTGNLRIVNGADDGDITFESDDGSGGVTEYFRVDGGAETNIFSKPIDITSGSSFSSDLDALSITVNKTGGSAVTNVKGINLNVGSNDHVSGNDITNLYGAYINNSTSGGSATVIQNWYGVYVPAADSDRVSNRISAYFADSVGIGTSLPTASLEVSRDSDDGTNAPSFRLTNASSTLADGAVVGTVEFNNEDNSGGDRHIATIQGIANSTDERSVELAFSPAQVGVTTEAMRIAKNGSVGIATNSPSNKLHIEGGNIQLSNNQHITWGFGGNNAIYGNDASDFIKIFTSGAERLIVNSSGNVGIATASPSEKLEVNGNIKVGDGEYVYLGDSNDLRLIHSSNSFIQNFTGDLYIENATDDKDIIFNCDDGSGGVATYFYLDGSVGFNRFPYPVIVEDSVNFNLGTGQDMQLLHNGSDSVIRNATGDLYIQQNVDDKDILFQCDDGSGSTTTYMFLDGSYVGTRFLQNVQLDDNVELRLGTNQDLRIEHSGSSSSINNYSNNLFINQQVDDGDIIFKCDDGSGGVTEYFRVDGGAETTIFSKPVQVGVDDTGHDVIFYGATSDMYLQWDESDNSLKLRDNVRLKIGSSNGLNIHHSGTNSEIKNLTGNLIIQNTSDDSDIIFKTDNGSGGTTTYLTLDGGNTRTLFSQEARFTDSVNLKFGTGGDTMIYHDGSNSYIDHTGTGNLNIRQGTDDGDISFQCDNGSGGLATYMSIDGGGTDVNFFKDSHHLDTVKAKFGSDSSGDLQIYHDGSNSVIKNATGDLYIRNAADDKDIIFQSDDGSGGVEIYFFLDGSANTDGNPRTKFPDNSRLMFGAGDDLDIFHDGSDSYIRNNSTSGDLKIVQGGDDKDIKLICDNGSGGTTEYITLDGSLGHTTVQKNIRFNDSVRADFGTGNDFRIEHDGDHIYLSNLTGDYYFEQKADDKDIIFTCDDGSGGNGEYLRLDGSATNILASQEIKIIDDKAVLFGTDGDAFLKHTGSKLSLTNDTGDIEFTQRTDNGDIQFFSDDGSGGTTEYFRIDGGDEKIYAYKDVKFGDGISASFGNNDLLVQHNGTKSFIGNYTGNLEIINYADDSDITFQSDNGSGGLATYYQIDGGSMKNNFFKDLLLTDNVKANFGSGSDLKIYHDGSHSYINNSTGDLIIRNQADDEDILFQCDNGSGGDTTYITIDGSAETVEVAKPINLASASSSASSGIYAQFINIKGFCTLAASYKFAEDQEDTLAPYEMAEDYGSDAISSGTEVNQSKMFRSSGFHVPVACNLNAINMQLTCNNTGNVTIALVEYRPSELAADQVDHPRTVFEEVVVASNDNNNKVKTVAVAVGDIDNTALPAGSHLMIMAKGDSDSVGGKAFISAAIEIKW